MLNWSRRTWSTVSVFLAGVLAICGIVVNVPQAIRTVIDSGPEFLNHPNTWWIVFVLLVEGLILFWIWRRPGEDDPYSRILDVFSGEPLRIQELGELLASLGRFHRSVRRCPADSIDANKVFDRLELVFSLRIKTLLGDEAESRFAEALKATKRAGPFIACAAVIPLAESMAWERVEELWREESRAPTM